jgi:hypothetical protein
MLPLHHDHHVSGDDRTRTGACSPDKRVLLPLSYVPLHSAGGIRTHDLELMRLARTASPLRRESARLESNQRSPAPKAGGVAKLPYRQKPIDTADAGFAGVGFPELNRSRCRSSHHGSALAEPDFDRSIPPAGFGPAASGLRVRRHSVSTTGAYEFRGNAEPDIRTGTPDVPMPALPASATHGRNRNDGRSKSSWLGEAEPDFDRFTLTAGLEPALRD